MTTSTPPENTDPSSDTNKQPMSNSPNLPQSTNTNETPNQSSSVTPSVTDKPESNINILRAPPSFPDSEPMRRIRMLLKEALITAGQRIQFKFHDDSFEAFVCDDGALKGPIDVQGYEQKFFTSPTEFVQSMAELAISRNPTKRQRGRIVLNGWDVCSYQGLTLASLRNNMLRRKRDIPQKNQIVQPTSQNPSPAKQAPQDESKKEQEAKKDESTEVNQQTTTEFEKSKMAHIELKDKATAPDVPSVKEDITKLETDNSPQKGDVKQHDHQKIIAGEQREEKGSQNKPKEVPLEKSVSSADNLVHSENEPKHSDKDIVKSSGNKEQALNKETSNLKDVAPETAQDSDIEVKPPTTSENKNDTKGSPETTLSAAMKNIEQSAKKTGNDNPSEMEIDAGSGSGPTDRAKKTEGLEKPNPTTDGPAKDSNPSKEIEKEAADKPSALSNTVTEEKPQDVGATDKTMQDVTISDQEENVQKDSAGISEKRNEQEKTSSEDVRENETQTGSDNPPITTDVAKDNEQQEDRSASHSKKRQHPGSKSNTPEKSVVSPGTKPDRKRFKNDDHEVIDSSEKEIVKETTEELTPVKSEENEKSPEVDQMDEIQPAKKDSSAKKSSSSKSRSPPKGAGTSRKKSRRDAGSGRTSRASTPSRRESDRTTRTKAESSKQTKRSSGPSGSVEMDPEAIQAVAIAEQADKEEANSRGRRTTRLAAGKIKQVDYKASANPLVPKGYLEQDSDEIEQEETGNEPVNDNSRNLRRRTQPQQTQLQPQRTSKRNRARKKGSGGSNGKSSSSGARNSSEGTGTNGSSRGSKRGSGRGSGRGESMDLEVSGKHKLTGTKQEGRERKRTRSDNGKRTRQQYSNDGEYDPYARTYGTRSSTRESPEDVEEITEAVDLSDNGEEEEDDLLEISVDMRTNYDGWNISELNCIAGAVKKSDSLDPSIVADALGQDDEWDEEDSKGKSAGAYVSKIVSSIEETFEMVGASSIEIEVDHVLAYLAAEAWRLQTGGLSTGIPHRPTSILNQVEKLEHEKSTLERGRKKIHREVEDFRSKLEAEMESRRKAELEDGFVTYQMHEATELLTRSREKQRKIEQEIQKYREMEGNCKARFDQMRILVSKLKGEKDASAIVTDGNKASGEGSRDMKNEENEDGSIRKNDSSVPGASVISDDVDMVDKPSKETNQKRLQMGRLRALIAAREAEAESFQRICEVKRMEYVSILEAKNRLDDELYHLKGQNLHGYGGSGSSATPAISTMRTGKEDRRKGESRGTAGPSSKTNGNRGKNSNSKPTVHSGTANKPGNGSKHRNHQGKNGDHNKNGKRKGTGKSHNGKTDK